MNQAILRTGYDKCLKWKCSRSGCRKGSRSVSASWDGNGSPSSRNIFRKDKSWSTSNIRRTDYSWGIGNIDITRF
jgi:hypothetical protein